jgi:methylated-DNA-[protein]-cysteine S-methyltransferase
MKSSFVYDTKIGDLHFFEDAGFITKISFGREDDTDYVSNESETIKKAYLETSEYLSGKRKEFTSLFKVKGTDFQKKVWTELQNIPYGETRTYGEIAKSINNPKAARAVGNANNKNPISIIIP